MKDHGSTGRVLAGEWIEVPSPELSPEAATVEGWFVWLTGDASLVSDASPEPPSWNLGWAEDGVLHYAIAGSAFRTDIRIDALRDSRWHYYVMRKEAEVTSYFIDGVPVFRGSIATAAPPSMPWFFMKDGPRDRVIKGIAADIAMYDKALPDDRISAHWVAGKDRPYLPDS